MTVEFRNLGVYKAEEKHILAFPDHYIAVAHKFEKQCSLATQTADGRYIVKAGTVVNGHEGARNAGKWGVALHDYDVTNGDKTGAVVVHGFLLANRMQEKVDATLRAALPQVTFLPVVGDAAYTAAALVVAQKGGATVGTHTAIVRLANGVEFWDAATTISNWTLTAASGSSASITNIVLTDDEGVEIPAYDAQRIPEYAKITYTIGTATTATLTLTAAATTNALNVASTATSII